MLCLELSAVAATVPAGATVGAVGRVYGGGGVDGSQSARTGAEIAAEAATAVRAWIERTVMPPRDESSVMPNPGRARRVHHAPSRTT